MRSKHIYISIISGFIGSIIGISLMILVSKMFLLNKADLNQPDTNEIQRVNYLIHQIPSAQENFINAADISVPAVVHIKTRFFERNYFYDFFSFFDFWGTPHIYEYPVNGAGSGVIVSSDGYIVTNFHVIDRAEEIEVITYDKRSFKARLIGFDRETDLAVLKIEGNNFQYLTFGDSDKLKVGEWVLAVGNPFNLTSTVTAGIVSAKARNIHLRSGKSIESFIQTDAAINRGNSGGALVNLNGELVGINTAIASTTGVFAGYSFAIPSLIAKKVVDDIIIHGKVQRVYLGISAVEINDQYAKEHNLNQSTGLLITEVDPLSSAGRAKLEPGDIILAINGEKLIQSSRMLEILNSRRPGDKIELTIKKRNGKTTNVSIVLDQLLNK